LLLVADGFTWAAFSVTLIGAMIGIGLLGVAFSGYMLTHLNRWQRWYIGIVSLLFVSPGLITMGIGLALISPIFWAQLKQRKGLT